MLLQLPRQVGPGTSVRFIGLGLCLSFALFFFLPYPPFTLLFLVLAAVLAYIRLEVAVALLPLTFPYYLFLKPLSSSGYPQFYIAELGLFICLGVALLRNILRADERKATVEWLRGLWQQARPLLLPALLFVLGASLSLLVSPDFHNSLRAYREQIIEPFLYFLLMLRYLRTRTDLARAVGALILSVLVDASLGLVEGFEHLTRLSDLWHPTALRISGPSLNPNGLGFLLDRSLPILLALTFVGLSRCRTADGASQRPAWRDPLRWICLILLIPFVWALYWTDSRGAEVGVLVALLFFLVIEVRSRFHSRRAILVMATAGILGIGLLSPLAIGFLNEQGHGNLSERYYIWKGGLLMIRDHFLLGTGPDSFGTLFTPTAPNSYLLQALDGQTIGSPGYVSHPHNFILAFWIATGLLGVVAAFWLFGAFAVVVGRAYHRCAAVVQGRLLQRLVLGIAGCMIAAVIHGMVDDFYFLSDLAMFFWFLMGSLVVLYTIVRQEEPTSVPDRADTAIAQATGP